MEEKKNNVVDMKPQSEKMPYEQLENIAHQLSEQTRQLYSKLQAANMTNMFKRLDYLFKVIEFGHVFNHDFLERCVEEIENYMTIPEESDDAEHQEDETE
jgi:hypothetical protein